MKWFVFTAMFLFSLEAHAYNDKKCFQFYTKNGLRKYDYFGDFSSEASKKMGSSKATSQASTQGTTRGIDPMVTTGEFSSTTQFVSSNGECSAIGLNEEQKKRESYIARNLDEIKQDVARGQGEHLDALYVLSGCGGSLESEFYRTLQSQFERLEGVDNERAWFSVEMDSILGGHPGLSTGCRNRLI
jgi:hypothetical protein